MTGFSSLVNRVLMRSSTCSWEPIYFEFNEYKLAADATEIVVNESVAGLSTVTGGRR